MLNLHKSKKDKIVCGICGGISEKYNINVNIVRAGAVLLLLMIGSLIFDLVATLLPALVSLVGGGLIGVAVYFIADRFID